MKYYSNLEAYLSYIVGKYFAKWSMGASHCTPILLLVEK